MVKFSLDMSHDSSEPTLITFGCRLNTYETEVMRNNAKASGLHDVIIVNTCAVTNEAERQARQAIRKAHRDNPEKQIFVTGCGAQVHPQMYAQLPGVVKVIGNENKMQPDAFVLHNSEKIVVSDIMQVKETANHLVAGFENHVRAFIEIQNGCDHRCTFCIIPFGRGNNRSIPIGQIAKQVELLVNNGCKEIVFTGVDITGYGKDLPGQPSLGQMMRRVLACVPQLARLRLSSLDPAEIDHELLALIATEPRLMPHFHISLQAGDDLILKRMKRRHLRNDVIEFTKKLKTLRPDAVFGADIIAGFPTETEEMHNNSLRIVQECDLTYLHVFPYSVRQGTPAARMPQVSKSVIKQRASNLRELGHTQLMNFFHNQIGKISQVLVERPGFGHCEQYCPVHFDSQEQVILGQIVTVKISHVQDSQLHSILVS